MLVRGAEEPGEPGSRASDDVVRRKGSSGWGGEERGNGGRGGEGDRSRRRWPAEHGREGRGARRLEVEDAVVRRAGEGEVELGAPVGRREEGMVERRRGSPAAEERRPTDGGARSGEETIDGEGAWQQLRDGEEEHR